MADASFTDQVPTYNQGSLSSARYAGQQAARAGTGHLVRTHLLPGTDHHAAREAVGA